MKYSQAPHFLAHRTDIPAAECEFCLEVGGGVGTTFSRLYGAQLRSRIVASACDVVALPTIGQLFAGHLLIVPLMHVETMASLSTSTRLRLEPFARTLLEVVGPNRPFALFEHGAKAEKGGGCGIYHAHLHAVPLPRAVALNEMLPFEFTVADNLANALDQLTYSEGYLLYATPDSCGYVDTSTAPRVYPSQYLRRRLSELLKGRSPWDWRSVLGPERTVIETVERFRRAHVPRSSWDYKASQDGHIDHRAV